jgi:uncharacterized membrane protein YjgN (DUF898 family)
VQESGPKPRSRHHTTCRYLREILSDGSAGTGSPAETQRAATAIVDRLIRLLIALAVAAASAAGVAVVLTIALAILGLYQSGHGGEAWTEKTVIDRGFAQMTIADVILLAAIALTAGLAFALSYRHKNRSVPASTQKKEP